MILSARARTSETRTQIREAARHAQNKLEDDRSAALEAERQKAEAERKARMEAEMAAKKAAEEREMVVRKSLDADAPASKTVESSDDKKRVEHMQKMVSKLTQEVDSYKERLKNAELRVSEIVQTPNDTPAGLTLEQLLELVASRYEDLQTTKQRFVFLYMLVFATRTHTIISVPRPHAPCLSPPPAPHPSHPSPALAMPDRKIPTTTSFPSAHRTSAQCRDGAGSGDGVVGEAASAAGRRAEAAARERGRPWWRRHRARTGTRPAGAVLEWTVCAHACVHVGSLATLVHVKPKAFVGM